MTLFFHFKLKYGKNWQKVSCNSRFRPFVSFSCFKTQCAACRVVWVWHAWSKGSAKIRKVKHCTHLNLFYMNYVVCYNTLGVHWNYFHLILGVHGVKRLRTTGLELQLERLWPWNISVRYCCDVMWSKCGKKCSILFECEWPLSQKI